MTKDQTRREWDKLVSNRGASTEVWFKAIRLFPFFYDKSLDVERSLYLLRELVQREEEVNNLLLLEPNFPWILTRLMAIFLGSVQSSRSFTEYDQAQL